MIAGRVVTSMRVAITLAAVSVVGLAGVVVDSASAVPAPGGRAAALSASFTSDVSSRYDQGWRRYYAIRAGRPRSEWHTYDRGVVTGPTQVLLRCVPPTGQGGFGGTTRYTWSVKSPSGRAVTVMHNVQTLCPAAFAARTEGTYSATLTVSRGSERATSTAEVRVNHQIIVSFGDSFSSGEGNPPWADTRCHRSLGSGAARAAARLERRRTVVTFLSFACSGDEIDKGINGPSDGAKPLADLCGPRRRGSPDLTNPDYLPECPKLPPQIDAAIKLLCGGRSPCPTDAPSVDAIFLNIGINDVAFSYMLRRCILGTTSCDENTKVRSNVQLGSDQIWAGLAQLAPRLKAAPFAHARIFLLQYPDDALDSELSTPRCGIFTTVNSDEARFLHITGLTLDGELLYAAAKYDWTPVPVAGRFRGHGYCADAPMLRAFTGSLLRQGDVDGTMHPNVSGHKAAADELVKATRTDFVPRQKLGTATVTFDSVAIHDKQARQANGLAPDHTAATFHFETYSSQYGVPVSWATAINYPDHLGPISTTEPTTLPPELRQTVEVYNKDPLVIHVNTSSLPLIVDPSPQILPIPVIPQRQRRFDDPFGPTHPDPRHPNPVDPGPINPMGGRFLQLTAQHSAADRFGATSSTGVGPGYHTVSRDTAIGTIVVGYHVSFEPSAGQVR
jgi:hypothetical protein